MRFQLTATPKTPGNDIEATAVIFVAASWDAAHVWGVKFTEQLGIDNSHTWVLTYASGTEGFFRNTVAERPRPLGADENIGSIPNCLTNGHVASADGKTCQNCGASLPNRI